MKETRARAIVREVAAATRRWRRFASDCDITQRQIDRMAGSAGSAAPAATAFEHDDAAAARA